MPPGCPVFNVWLKACNPQPNVRCPSLFLGRPVFRQLFSNREQTSTCLFMLSHNNLTSLKFQEKLTWEKLLAKKCIANCNLRTDIIHDEGKNSQQVIDKQL